MSNCNPKRAFCAEPQELVDLCVNCKQKTCDGKPCAQYHAVARSKTVRERRKKTTLAEYPKMRRNNKDIAMDRLRLMYVDYELFRDIIETPGSSLGMVANYASTGGGKTNRVSDHTARQALQTANISPERQLRYKWLECTHAVCAHLLTQTAVRSRVMGHVLYHRALLGWTFTKIAELPLPNGKVVSQQCVYKYYSLAVDEVVDEAVKRTLLR